MVSIATGVTAQRDSLEPTAAKVTQFISIVSGDIKRGNTNRT